MSQAEQPGASGEARTSLTGARKAAILMIMLGDQLSGTILGQMDEEEVAEVSREVAKISSISAEHAETVLEECYQMSAAQNFLHKGGIEYARRMLMNALGPEHAKKLLDRVLKSLGSEAATFDALQKADPHQVAKFIYGEHPQTVALVLSHLNPSQAAALLASLPEEIRPDVALRMASLDQISPDVISRIAAIIGQKLKAFGEFSRESYGGVRAVAEMFNRMDSNTSKEILNRVEVSDSNLVETIRHLMFIFEDLVLLDEGGVKEVLSRVDRKMLTVAMKGTSDKLKHHFLQCMSQRGAEMLTEDMEALGPIKIKEVESAQQQIIAIVRQLEAEGVISLKGTIGDQYVV